VLGFGPEAAVFATAIPSPDGAFDLLVVMGVAFDEETTPVEVAHYRQRLRDDPTGITEGIARAACDALFGSGVAAGQDVR
jgi:hypothetical protein